jgi:hypothetical protein
LYAVNPERKTGGLKTARADGRFMSALIDEVAWLKEFLRCEQANHRKFRTQIYSDPEFKAIIERREKEKYDERTQKYIDRLLGEIEELESVTAY